MSTKKTVSVRNSLKGDRIMSPDKYWDPLKKWDNDSQRHQKNPPPAPA